MVTPLVSLMEDQVMYLKATNVSAAMLNASSSKVGFPVGQLVGHFVTWSPCLAACLLQQPTHNTFLEFDFV